MAFSFGGLFDETLGLRRRVRLADPPGPDPTLEMRRMAEPILTASTLLIFRGSSPSGERLLLSRSSDFRFRILLLLIWRRGVDCSVSDKESLVKLGGAGAGPGEPSLVFLDKNPAWNLEFLGYVLGIDGGVGIGEDSLEPDRRGIDDPIVGTGREEGELDGCCGDAGGFCGVFSNSARGPSSASSFHLTLLLAGFPNFFGVK